MQTLAGPELRYLEWANTLWAESKVFYILLLPLDREVFFFFDKYV